MIDERAATTSYTPRSKEDRDRRTLFFACRNCEHQVQPVSLYICSTNNLLARYPRLSYHIISPFLQEWPPLHGK